LDDRSFVLLQKISVIWAVLVLCLAGQAALLAQIKTAVPNFTVSRADDAFLEDLSRRSFLYLWEQTDPKTGLTLDRTRTDGTRYQAPEVHHNVASIAASGFALTSYCIAADRKWIPVAEAKQRTRNTLDFFADRAANKDGWFYHWMDTETGERRWKSEISTVDTALLLAGILTVRSCFADDKQIVETATKIFNRVNFPAMLGGDKYLLTHGWKDETGFIKNRWDDYSEASILYILGIGSETYPLEWKSWYAWKRTYTTYKNYKYLAAVPPLFIHQYSHAWIDFRGKRERYRNYNTDYYENSVKASRAQRLWSKDNSRKFPGYAGNMWGISASDSVKGYTAWGTPPPTNDVDGSVVPYAPAGSMMFTPDISLPALKEMKGKFGDKVYGKYGFTDAFNPNTGWINKDVVGIDVGMTLVGIENFRTGNVWKWFMKNAEAKNGLRRAMIR
jgi:hypothetical protein